MYERFLNFLGRLKTKENALLLEHVTQGFVSMFRQGEPNNVWNDPKTGQMTSPRLQWSSQPSGSGDEYFPTTTIQDPSMKNMVAQSKMGYRIGALPQPRKGNISLKDLGITSRGGYNVNGVQGGMPSGNGAGYNLGGPPGAGSSASGAGSSTS